jgi:folate-binding protein YgfZ
MSQLFVVPLEHLGILRFRGADTLRFLQGQLSNDVERLRTHPALFAGLHDPQGRVLALLRLFAIDDDHVLAVLPRELLPGVQERLARVVLRAKVRIDVADPEWRAYGLCGPDAEAGARLKPAARLSDDPLRLLVVAPRHEPQPEGDELESEEWEALEVADGIPEVLTATTGQFVSQMLNLDVLDGISFDKGCYTGQEIIARAHYRGRVKRRLQRFATEDARVLVPGERVQLTDGRRVQIVRWARFGQVGSEFLAVAPLAEAAAPPGENAGEEAGPSEGEPRLAATPLALPYQLPP